MTKILRLDARPDADAILASEVLRISLILGSAIAILLWLHRLS